MSKYLGQKLHFGELMVLLGIGTILVTLISSPGSFNLKLSSNTLIGLAAGIFCALGYLFFYKALAKGEASSVIPISSMYILVVAILAIAVLREPLTVKKALGLISAIAAIVLLS